MTKHINTIRSTSRNENGRTPFVMHKMSDGKPKFFRREILNSTDDEKRVEQIESDMEEARRDSIIKQHKSMMDAHEIILTA